MKYATTTAMAPLTPANMHITAAMITYTSGKSTLGNDNTAGICTLLSPIPKALLTP